ncbi:MAG: pilin [Patescibacteria group bacterium]|nr:pilin [Patescibacteria group bacterium]
MRKIFVVTTVALTIFFSALMTAAPAMALMPPPPPKPDGLTSFLTSIGIPDGQLVPTKCTGEQGKDVNDCGLDQLLQVIINIATLIVAVTGTAALVMILYGGVLWIISAGSQEKIQQGKAAITAAAIGLTIVLTSWLVVNFIILALTGGTIGTRATIFRSTPFGQIPSNTGSNP